MKKTARPSREATADTLSVTGAARAMGIQPSELRRRLGHGELPFIEIRGRIRVPKKSIKKRKP